MFVVLYCIVQSVQASLARSLHSLPIIVASGVSMGQNKAFTVRRVVVRSRTQQDHLVIEVEGNRTSLVSVFAFFAAKAPTVSSVILAGILITLFCL